MFGRLKRGISHDLHECKLEKAGDETIRIDRFIMGVQVHRREGGGEVS